MNFIMKISQLGEKQMTYIVCNKIKYCGVVLKNEFYMCYEVFNRIHHRNQL